MSILTHTRTKHGNPCWKLQSDSSPGTFYWVVYVERPSGQFEGSHSLWLCTCENFLKTQLEAGGHCKHILEVQEKQGTSPVART